MDHDGEVDERDVHEDVRNHAVVERVVRLAAPVVPVARIVVGANAPAHSALPEAHARDEEVHGDEDDRDGHAGHVAGALDDDQREERGQTKHRSHHKGELAH